MMLISTNVVVTLLTAISVATACLGDGYFELTLCTTTGFRNCQVIKTQTGCCYPMPAPYVTSLNSAKGWLDTCNFFTNSDCTGGAQCIDSNGYSNMANLPAYRSYICNNGGPAFCP